MRLFVATVLSLVLQVSANHGGVAAPGSPQETSAGPGHERLAVLNGTWTSEDYRWVQAGGAQPVTNGDGVTVIYFVRHAEVDPAQPTFPLNAAGRLKAAAFARAVSAVRFTHILSSHTTRARQMVEPVALARKLQVLQFPRPGAQPDGTVVSDGTSSSAAIAPLVQALHALTPGSRALVGVNSDNVYAILNGLGVPAATPERPCPDGGNCVPCLTNACAAPRYDQLWVLLLERDALPPTLIELRYGDTGAP